MTPISRPSKIVCVGRNYVAHAAEFGNEVPSEPLLFLKPPSALIQAGEAIVIPPWAGRVDFEGEIGVLMGRRASKLREEEALDYVEAILPVNDVTAREIQRKEKQWTRGKGCDTFCPVGEPAPVDQVDLEKLSVVTRVNGQERQRGSTDLMVFSIPFLIAYISRFMTLEPGDLLATGTPEGVGPLAPGDQVEVELEGLTTLTNPVVMGEGPAPGEEG
jgi:2-keto-4-pentenoate hydratase/2-oxohepta-3-ene-1,7-dioic acid hydratase in catechol pathway